MIYLQKGVLLQVMDQKVFSLFSQIPFSQCSVCKPNDPTKAQCTLEHMCFFVFVFLWGGSVANQDNQLLCFVLLCHSLSQDLKPLYGH